MTTGRFDSDPTTARGQADAERLKRYLQANCVGCAHPASLHDKSGFCRVCRRLEDAEPKFYTGCV